METRNNKLLLFNSMMLLNKREVLESFDDFVEHQRQMDNEEGYSEGKRKILLSLCDEFRKKLEKSDIPALTKPWLFYDYSITNDSIELLLWKCSDVEFDDEGEISSMSSNEEYTLAEVKCNYLTVAQYAVLYGVTTTTVRQWIRRGKLRTAVKKGRDWLIPALADKPRRGFESVTYHWKVLTGDIIESFPFLAEADCVYLFQDDEDKKIFYAIIGWPGAENRQKVALTSKEREQLEIMLIALPGVQVEGLSAEVRYVPAKRSFSLPILSYQDGEMMDRYFAYEDIIVQQSSMNATHFSPGAKPRDSFSYDYTSTYLVAVHWTFWGVPHDNEDILYNALGNGDYSGCTKIGTLSGNLILCKQMIADGYDPLIVCDDESADLEYVMSVLVDEGGPLNEWTGEPMLDVFYVHELIIEESLRLQGLGSRILQEAPSICRELLHVAPDILTYYPAPTKRNWHKESEKEKALRNIAANRVAKSYSSDEEEQGQLDSISFDDRYRLSDDEINMIMGRRHSGSSYPEELKNFNLIAFYNKNGLQEMGDSRLLYAYTEGCVK